MINYALDNRDDFGDITILQGTRAHQDRFFVDELDRWGKRRDMHLMETVDAEHPEWQGSIGVVTVLMPRIEADLPASMILICGPPIMYKFVLMALWEAQVPKQNIFVNLERRMKCGVGKCGHCQINHEYVCQEGPVFRYSDLTLVPEAI
jgi:NAD(P)H-flavin reductase